MSTRKRKELGQYIVANSEICHGHLTFKGTRIMVKSVLYYVAQGKDWDWILRAYYGHISRDAIAEAVGLANERSLSRKDGESTASRVNILDEDISAPECARLRTYKIHFRQIGIEVGHEGSRRHSAVAPSSEAPYLFHPRSRFLSPVVITSRLLFSVP